MEVFSLRVWPNVFTSNISETAFFGKRNGGIYAVGTNIEGELGVGDTIFRSKLTEVPLFSQITVEMIACGAHHTIFLAKLTREVYGCGDNGYLQLGFPSRKSHHSPERIPFFTGRLVKKICCSSNSTYCLTSLGQLFAFGCNSAGQLGIGDGPDLDTPTLVRFPQGSAPLDISCGDSHVAVLCSDGRVFTFGENIDGQLGRRGDESKPGEVKLPEGARTAKKVICGSFSTFILSSDKEVYALGNNACGGLGLGDTEDRKFPVRISYFNDNPLAKISCGGGHVVCLLKSNEICSFGGNSRGQLFHSDHQDRYSPSIPPPKLLRGVQGLIRFLDVQCGSKHTLITTLDGRCYAVAPGWGKKVKQKKSIKPRLLCTDVKMGIHNFMWSKLGKYIMEEQDIEPDKTSTDGVIHVNDQSEGGVDLRINRQFVRERLGLKRELAQIDFSGRFEKAIRDQFLQYIYEDRIDLSKLVFLDIIKLSHLLSKYGICSKLRRCCKKIITEERDSENGTQSHFTAEGDHALAVAIPLTAEPSLIDVMTQLFETRAETGDIVLAFGEDMHRAHKFVLVARCKYFRTMFRDMAGMNGTNLVEMDIPLGKSFDFYLRYLYTGEMEFSYAETLAVLPYVEFFDESDQEEEHLRKYFDTVYKVVVGGVGVKCNLS